MRVYEREREREAEKEREGRQKCKEIEVRLKWAEWTGSILLRIKQISPIKLLSLRKMTEKLISFRGSHF